VKRIIQFAVYEMPDYALIVEYDVSKITIHGFEFRLGGLKLLTTGKTWYNSLGFYENEYKRNTDLVDEYIHRPIKPKAKITIIIKEHFSGILAKLIELSKIPKDELTEKCIGNQTHQIRVRAQRSVNWEDGGGTKF
jgi:hypothetical protein